MRHCNQGYSVLWIAFGLGALAGSLIESGFFCAILILGALGVGCISLTKRR